MTHDAALVLKCLFEIIWQLFTSWHIPGTSVTPAMAALFFIAAGVSLRFVLGFFQSPGASVSGGADGIKAIRGRKK